jgi:hypothetical protein
MHPVGNVFVLSYLLRIYMLIYSLFNDFSTLNYIAQNDWMIN